MNKIQFSDLINISELSDYDIEDVEEQLEMANEAQSFLLQHEWCISIVNGWYDRGWAGILAIFLFELIPVNTKVDNYVWIVVGDLPSAYIDIKSAQNGASVLYAYTRIMNDWVTNVLKGLPIDDCYPINVPPTNENASMLDSRIKFIEKEILPLFRDEMND